MRLWWLECRRALHFRSGRWGGESCFAGDARSSLTGCRSDPPRRIALLLTTSDSVYTTRLPRPTLPVSDRLQSALLRHAASRAADVGALSTRCPAPCICPPRPGSKRTRSTWQPRSTHRDAQRRSDGGRPGRGHAGELRCLLPPVNVTVVHGPHCRPVNCGALALQRLTVAVPARRTASRLHRIDALRCLMCHAKQARHALPWQALMGCC